MYFRMQKMAAKDKADLQAPASEGRLIAYNDHLRILITSQFTGGSKQSEEAQFAARVELPC